MRVCVGAFVCVSVCVRDFFGFKRIFFVLEVEGKCKDEEAKLNEKSSFAKSLLHTIGILPPYAFNAVRAPPPLPNSHLCLSFPNIGQTDKIPESLFKRGGEPKV